MSTPCTDWTRWAVLSDIHGNLPALEAVLAALRAEGVELRAVMSAEFLERCADTPLALALARMLDD